MNESLLAELTAARSDSDRARIVMDFSLNALDEELRHALRAAAVPHWFDVRFLSALLEVPHAQAQELFARLLRLSHVERISADEAALQAHSRDVLLQRLWRDDRPRFIALSRRAAEFCAGHGGEDPRWYVESIYHRFVANPESALACLRQTWHAWCSGSDFVRECARPVVRVIREHVDAGRMERAAGTWVELWKAMANKDRGRFNVALALEGGGGRCAYQAGAYQALVAQGLEPACIVAESMGAITAAIIAGNPPEQRVERLREFWDTVSTPQVPWLSPWLSPWLGPWLKRGPAGTLASTLYGVPGLFTPRPVPPFLTPPGSPGATSFYDMSPLRDTLMRIVDFDRLNGGDMRVVVSAVNAATGLITYFDNRVGHIRPEHIIASAALPPGFPMVSIDGSLYWDAGLIANTPLQYILGRVTDDDLLVFQVRTSTPLRQAPSTLEEVNAQAQNIARESRARLVTEYYDKLESLGSALRTVVDKLPPDQLTESQKALSAGFARQARVVLVNIADRPTTDDQPSDFHREAVLERWGRGYRHTMDILESGDAIAISETGGVSIRGDRPADDPPD